MSEYLTHPTNENLRIRVTYDECPSQPYDDGGFPIWRIERSGNFSGYGAEQETAITSYTSPHELDYALGEIYGRDGWTDVMMLRYLRIFWGCTFVEQWHSGSYWYVTCDPADWREHVGITDEHTRREDYTKHAFTEWQAWCEGNVHLAWPEQRVQKEVKTTTIYPDGTREDDFRSYEDEWIESEDHFPVGGFYGDLDEDMRTNMLWQFGWPSAACKHCGEGIVKDVNHGWVDDDVPFDERDKYKHCRMGVMMHVRGPLHEPRER